MKNKNKPRIEEQDCEHYLIEMQDVLQEQIDNLMNQNMTLTARIETNFLIITMLGEKLKDVNRQLAEGENE